jgi:hypothetical protein
MKKIFGPLLIILFHAVSAFAGQNIPSEVRAAAAVIFKASDKDGIHEEGFKWGRDTAGNVLISYASPGPQCPPPPGNCQLDFISADPSIDEKFVTIDGFAHVHPKGNANHITMQKPSNVDLAFAALTPPGTINLVIGSGSQIVYFFDSKGVTSTVKLKDFLKP